MARAAARLPAVGLPVGLPVGFPVVFPVGLPGSFPAGLLAALLACSTAGCVSAPGDPATPGSVSSVQVGPPRSSRAPDYTWDLPPGFPVPRVPKENPMSDAKVSLGRHLFYDERLSGDGTLSCAGCHRQELAFTDGRARAVGATGEQHPRSAMSLANVAYGRTLNWADPAIGTLEHQLDGPLFNREPVELGLGGRETEVLERLRDDLSYQVMFVAAFPGEPDPISIDNVKRALASFERTIISGRSAYDRLVFEDDRESMSEEARAGMRLFFSERLRCVDCHAGFTFSGPTVHEGSSDVAREFHNNGLYGMPPGGRYPDGNRGLYERTREPSDMGRFRAPTLRNIALTAPYMHDGSIETLEGVLEHYAAGGRRLATGPHAGDGRVSPHKSEQVAGFEISSEETRQVIAFLESLTDPELLKAERLSDPWSRSTTQLPE